jgi:hypothetical protein
LGNAGRGCGLTLFGDRRIGDGSDLMDGGGGGGCEGGSGADEGCGTDSGAGPRTFAVTSGGATNAAGAWTTGTFDTIGVGAR